ncbi:PorP/SprF family type IX secretion system membrane protein [Paracrocinitomix mangrovi]|uniref:PorP/SprF family type IX secretion system membrane protein n=1 Tax=Paracrocinitomix mangrovi TaxID=2862509 RepID=UPI001C8EBF35|nr:PorP/SprF family type IX secretion system membrane protein [Paracrocinitomix mangrovi]UKN00763.1 PorP/SprF family type IX secretion system membrane protein [Paracrocinitomix mangrovi]
MKRLITTIAVLAVTYLSTAQQDRHFSMFFANPVQLNPGAAGHIDGDLCIFTNYRTQWFTVTANPFRSFSAGVDAKLFDNKLKNGFIGTGINFLNDVSGDAKFSLNVIQVPINYTLDLNKTSQLSLGLQPGFYAQRLNENALYFDNQWTGIDFNTAVSSGETLGAYNLSRFDLSAGLFYDLKTSDRFNMQLGLGGFHLTAQEVSFFQVSEKLYRNFTFYGKAMYRLDDSKLSFHPALFGLFQGPNWELTFGNNFEIELKESSKHTGYFDGMSLSFGVYYRTSDALMTNIIYKAGALGLGVGYDINLSGLTVASKSVGAVELFLKFTPSFAGSAGGAARIQ